MGSPTLAQAAEIRQQLAVLQAKIQSMQPLQSSFNTSNQFHSANQSQPNPPPRTIAQPTFDTPYTLPQTHRTINSKSPLSEGLQSSPWPPSYKPIILPKFNGTSDPRQFIISFEAAVASASRNEAVLAKSFVMAAKGDALAWYSMLKSSSVYPWEDLRDKILANFKGFISESLTSMDLFQCKQNQREALNDYF